MQSSITTILSIEYEQFLERKMLKVVLKEKYKFLLLLICEMLLTMDTMYEV